MAAEMDKKYSTNQNLDLTKQIKELQSQVSNQIQDALKIQDQLVKANASSLDKQSTHQAQIHSLTENIKHLQQMNDSLNQDKLRCQEELSKAMLQLGNSKIIRR